MNHRLQVTNLKKIRERYDEYLKLNPYALALMRMALGFAVVIEALERLSIFSAFFSRSGLFPAAYMSEVLPKFLMGPSWLPNLHLIPLDILQIALIVLQLLIGLTLIIGVGPRWILLVLIYLACASNQRMYFLLKGGDVLLPWMALLVFCLPTRQVWAWKKKAEASTPLQAAALLIFVILTYMAAGLPKINSTWLGGRGILNSLEAEAYVTHFGLWLVQFKDLLTALSPVVPYLEACVPLLLVLPFAGLRAVICFVFISFHLLLGASMDLGNLTPLMIAFWVALLPNSVFRRLPKVPAVKVEKAALAKYPAAIAVAILLVFVSNFNSFTDSNFLNQVSFSTHNVLFRFGIRGQMLFYSYPPSTKFWVRFTGYDQSGKPQAYDLFRDKWAGEVSEEPPKNIRDEVAFTRRTQGAIDCLLMPRCTGHYRQYHKVMCSKLDANGQKPVKVEGIRYTVPLDTRYAPSRAVVFSGDCAQI